MGVRPPPFAKSRYYGISKKMKIVLFFLLFFSPLLAEVDRNVRSFSKSEKKIKIDQFDFSGDWPNLENIDIDGQRKKRVEIDLSGNYPLLKQITFQGGFGILDGQLTGTYPLLESVQFLCGSRKITLDLTAQWQKNCEMKIIGSKEDITLVLPANVNLIVDTKVALKGRVFAEGLTKKGWGVLKKRYEKISEQSEIATLTLYVETTEGNIYLYIEPS